jgi:hypothetical protein
MGVQHHPKRLERLIAAQKKLLAQFTKNVENVRRLRLVHDAWLVERREQKTPPRFRR